MAYSTFRDEEKKPLYGLIEFEAAVKYLELSSNIVEAQKLGLRSVMSGYESLSLDEAERREARYRSEFDELVAQETRRRFPNLGNEELAARIKTRGEDILASIEDTSRISAQWR